MALDEGPATFAASPSTSAHVRDSRISRSTRSMSDATRQSDARSSSSTDAIRHSCTGRLQSAVTIATRSSWPSAGSVASADFTTFRIAGTLAP